MKVARSIPKYTHTLTHDPPTFTSLKRDAAFNHSAPWLNNGLFSQVTHSPFNFNSTNFIEGLWLKWKQLQGFPKLKKLLRFPRDSATVIDITEVVCNYTLENGVCVCVSYGIITGNAHMGHLTPWQLGRMYS